MRSLGIVLLALATCSTLNNLPLRAQEMTAASTATAQASAPPAAATGMAAPAGVAPFPADLQEVVTKQFGPCFKLSMNRSYAEMHYKHPPAAPPWVNFMEGDFDGDGVTDAVIVARCATPLAMSVQFDYKVSDPYFAANGYGNPKVTAAFASEDPDAGNLLLIIHGSGKEGWRAATPKAKFVIINLPFNSVSMSAVKLHKKVVPAVSLVDGDEMSSAVFWDGKKYRWEDTAGH